MKDAIPLTRPQRPKKQTVTISVEPADLDMALRIGYGNLSKGFRTALREYAKHNQLPELPRNLEE